MPQPKDTSTVIDELDRLQKLTPHRLQRLEQKTALIKRSVTQVGLVSNSIIRQLDREDNPQPFDWFWQLDDRIIISVLIVGGLGLMVLTYIGTEWLLTLLFAPLLR